MFQHGCHWGRNDLCFLTGVCVRCRFPVNEQISKDTLPPGGQTAACALSPMNRLWDAGWFRWGLKRPRECTSASDSELS